MGLTVQQLQLQPGRWYGWQMLPGYVGMRNVPYFSPILVQRIRPRKSGLKILNLEFFNAFYAEGVQDFSVDLRILKHEADYLVAELVYEDGGHNDRTAVVSHIEFDWIRRFCPELWDSQPPSSLGAVAEASVTEYLNSVYMGGDTR